MRIKDMAGRLGLVGGLVALLAVPAQGQVAPAQGAPRVITCEEAIEIALERKIGMEVGHSEAIAEVERYLQYFDKKK